MKTLLEPALRELADRTATPFAVRFPDGRELRLGAGEPAFTIRLNTPAAERRIALYRHIGLLESYFDGELDLEGDLRRALATGMGGDFARPNGPVALRNRWHELRHSNATWEQAKANARFHYALGTGFYRYWLDDPLMMYT